MHYSKHEFVYALHITDIKYDTTIRNGEIDDFHSCITDYGYNFYFYEALLLKFKYFLDNDIIISENSIYKYFNILRGSIVDYTHLKTIVLNLSALFIEINGCVYPISLVSRHKECLTIYLDFLLKRLYNTSENIEDFIKNNFR